MPKKKLEKPFKKHLIAFVLIIATLAVFCSVTGYDFVHWDDDRFVYENPYLKPVTISNIFHFWEKPYKMLYIPLTGTVWSFLAKLSQLLLKHEYEAKLNPQLFHTANLILHILNVLIVFAILRLLLNYHFSSTTPKSKIRNPNVDWAAGLGTMLFALHPVQVESVAWVSAMKDLLCGFFSLIAIWQYLVFVTLECKFQDSNYKKQNFFSIIRSPNYVMATIALFLALLSKPTAVVVPIITWILCCFMLKGTMKRSFVALIGWIVIVVPFLVIAKLAQPEVGLNYITPLWMRPLVAGDAIAFYLYKLICPLWLGINYGRSPEFVVHQRWIYFTWLVPIGLGVFIRYRMQQWRYLLTSFGIFIAGIIPVCGLISFRFQNYSTVADHYLYISMLGPALAMAFFILYHYRTLVIIMCVFLLCLLGVRSKFQEKYWRNSLTLLEHAVEINPNSSKMYYNLGIAYFQKKHYKNAITEYENALRLEPDFADAHNNLGIAYRTLGQLRRAMQEYQTTLRLNPEHRDVHYNLGMVYANLGRWEEAIKEYQETLRIIPDYPDAHYNMGIAYANLGRC